VTAIIVIDSDGVADTLAAARRQVYGSARVVLVGGDAEVRRVADTESVAWAPSIAGLLGAIPPAVTHLWVLRTGAIPRPDALGALVLEAERNDAAIAGSKLLRADDPERLISIGMATDVFDFPYFGIDADEIDAGQYDVVRDVAAVPGASILMRRDLAKGVHGVDALLAPIPAAVDLCQRARLRGARVIVVPSSEVMIDVERTRARPWREEAGRIRAMLKVYSLLTLVWALPLTFLIGLIEALVVPFLGRWTLFAFLRGWAWNVGHLPSTLAARRQARRGRVVDDAELFRFQLRGSARLKILGSDIASALRSRLGIEEGFGLSELSRDLRQPAFVVAILAVAFALFATRQIWGSGLPLSGYSLALPTSGRATVEAYAGGWNPAGLGSTEPLRPFLGLAGLLQVVLLDRPAATMSLLVVGAAVSALWGTTRLLRSVGVETVAALFGAGVLLAGPAARAMTGDTGLTTWISLGVLPWAVRLLLARHPSGLGATVGRFAAAGWVTGVLAAVAPLAALIPLAAVVLWAALQPTQRSSWRAVLLGAGGLVLAVPLLLPWIAAADLARFVSIGNAYWEPGWLLIIGSAAALAAVVVAGPERLAIVGIWGAMLGALGALLARTGDFGAGREVEHAGLAAASLGSAILVAAALDALRRVDFVHGWRRLLLGVGALAALLVVSSTFIAAIPGRIGLPGDKLGDRLAFTEAALGDPASSRILVIGPGDALPGDARSLRGASYRLVSAPLPTLDEAWLADPTEADAALAAVMRTLINGETSRAGEALAPFGVRWVISLAESPLEDVFAGQLDLVPLGTSDGVALTVDGEQPVRAIGDDGTPWSRTPTGYAGPPGEGTVFVAESANLRWSPGWAQQEWGNALSAAEGTATFRAIPTRRTQAVAAFGLLIFLLVASWWGRRLQ
jgi:hypothetical protein